MRHCLRWQKIKFRFYSSTWNKTNCSSSSVLFFSSRFQLSLRVAAMCSKASYRVKTMDSLDYRDLVCVFSNTKSHCYWSLLIFHKSKENMMFKPPHSTAEGGKYLCAQTWVGDVCIQKWFLTLQQANRDHIFMNTENVMTGFLSIHAYCYDANSLF